MHVTTRRGPRWMAGLAVLSLLGPFAGCANSGNSVNAANPPNDYGSVPPPQRTGGGLANMSTGKKLALIAGAAALYYMYKNRVNAQNQPARVQYYRSRNGGIYYRDANHVAHWVTPPAQGFQVPADEAARYEREARQQGFRDTAPSGMPAP